MTTNGEHESLLDRAKDAVEAVKDKVEDLVDRDDEDDDFTNRPGAKDDTTEAL